MPKQEESQSVKVEQISLDDDATEVVVNKNCQHSVYMPDDYKSPEEFDPQLHGTAEKPKWNGSMAKKYPFELDEFQSLAVSCLERRESVLVAAHTSAGKTAVAEYAIAMAFRDNQRVIYTSPLKALSNQKFGDLKEEFDDVGLMTGDTVANPNARAIVMTTEILRNMIYKGSELIREVAWVIFDEVHYMQDRERGVVWEETIIFLPPTVHMVFLSATLPNAGQFAAWISSQHKQPCHVVYTDYRPTPLSHYAFPLKGDGVYKLIDESGAFQQHMFEKLRKQIAPNESDKPGDSKKPNQKDSTGKPNKNHSVSQASIVDGLLKIIKLVQNKKLQPLLIFAFSRREVEFYSLHMVSKGISFTDKEEQEAIEMVFNNALKVLKEEDRQMAAILQLLPILKAGIGMHHSGLLPILKEVVEILFSEGLVKCLIATETFAMGVNMPAKTVVFTRMKKFDGSSTRWLQSSEYIQMAGRAGRRGKDVRGYVLFFSETDLDDTMIKSICLGQSKPLISQFKLSYYTLLNIFKRSQDSRHSIHHVIEHSFQQFQQDAQLPQLRQRAEEIEAQLRTCHGVEKNSLQSFIDLQSRARERLFQYQSAAFGGDENIRDIFVPGRMVRARSVEANLGWGVVVSVYKEQGSGGGDDGGKNKKKRKRKQSLEEYFVDIILPCVTSELENRQVVPGDITNKQTCSLAIIPLNLLLISDISSIVLDLPPDLTSEATLDQVQSVMVELVNMYGDEPPLMCVGEQDDDVKQQEDEKSSKEQKTAQKQQSTINLKRIHQKLHEQMAKLESHPQREKALRSGEYGSLGPGKQDVEASLKKASLQSELDDIKRQMKVSQVELFKEDAERMGQVLKRLGLLDEQGVVTKKGRAGSEIDTADELVTVELMFNGVFNNLDAHQLLALSSCLIPCDQSNDEIHVKQQLAEPLQQLQDTARKVATISKECNINIEEEDYIQSFAPTLMDVVFAWSRGAPFSQISKLTDIYEGSIVRAMRRLDELIQQLQRCAAVAGDQELEKKFEQALQNIRRDIMGCASLYIGEQE